VELPPPPEVPVISDIGEFLRQLVARSIAILTATLQGIINSIISRLPTVADLMQTVQNTVDAVRRSLADIVNLAATSIERALRPQLEAIENVIGQFQQIVNAIVERMRETLGALERQLESLVSNITQMLSQTVETFRGVIESITAQFREALAAILQAAQATVGDILARLVALGEDVKKLLSRFFENPAQFILDIFMNLAHAGVDVTRKVIEIVAAAINAAVELFIPPEAGRLASQTFDNMYALLIHQQFPEADAIYNNVRNMIDQLSESGIGRVIISMLLVVATLFSIFSVLGAFAQPVVQDVGYRAMQAYRSTELTPAELVKLSFYDFPESLDILPRLAKYGYDQQRINELRKLYEQRLDPTQLLAYWLRHDKQVNIVMDLIAQGYRTNDIKILQELAEYIPPTQDIIRMAVREVFTPEVAEKFGQFQDFPQDFATWAARVGVSDFWARAYWAAHWELPSAGQGFEMFHRGIISRDELVMLLRALDVMPYWRDRLIQLSYDVMTRIDTQRARQLGVLTRDQVRQNYLKMGYSPEDAEILTNYTEKLVEERLLGQTAETRRAVAAATSSTFEKRLIDENTYRQNLANLQYSEHEIDIAIQRSKIEKQLKLLDRVEDICRRAYIKAAWNADQTRNVMRSWGFSDAIIDEDLRIWQLERQIDEDYQHIRKERDLAKGDILDGFEYGMISHDDALAMLVSLGYDNNEAQYLLTRATLTRHKKLINQTVDMIRNLYVEGIYDDIMARQMLAQLTLPAEYIDRTLQVWSTVKTVTQQLRQSMGGG